MSFFSLLSMLIISIIVLPISVRGAVPDPICTDSTLVNMQNLFTKLGLEIPTSEEEEEDSLNSYCDWEGVECSTAAGSTSPNGEYAVIGLNFDGRLSPNTEDEESIYIPRELACLQTLESIDLSNNDIHNTIPAVLYDMENIKNIAIHDALLFGTIPTHFCYLKKLESLDLSNNFLYGEIPECISRPVGLKTVDLHCNQLGGNVQRRVVNAMETVVDMNLDCNEDLKFPSYANITNDNSEATCASCPQLDIFHGSCTYGPIKGCEDMEYYLQDPQVEECQADQTNSIPEECLSGDEEEGECAEELTDFCDKPLVQILDRIYKAYNENDDTLGIEEDTTMEELCSAHTELECEDNVPTAITITSSPGDSDALNTPFPQEVACIDGLKSLTLEIKGNALTFPAVICQITSLETLIIDSPAMYGRIPDCIGNLENLKTFEILSSNLQGPLPDTMGDLTNLESLKIYCMTNGKVLPLSIYHLENLNVEIVNSDIKENENASSLDPPLASISITKDPNVTCPDPSDALSDVSINIKGCGDYDLILITNTKNEVNPETGLYYLCEDKEPWELLMAVYDQLRLSDWYNVDSSTSEESANETESDNTNICSWKGVRCTGNNISLDFTNTGITTLPDEIGCIQNITSLILGDNPIEEVPESICMLKNLEYLSLENTDITQVLECVYELQSLTTLNLCGDDIEEPEPAATSPDAEEEEEVEEDEADYDHNEEGEEEEEEETEEAAADPSQTSPSATRPELVVLTGRCCHVRPRRCN